MAMKVVGEDRGRRWIVEGGREEISSPEYIYRREKYHTGQPPPNILLSAYVNPGFCSHLWDM